MNEYQPEQWTVPKDTIYAAIAALKDGKEYAEELLMRHDEALGRTFKSNREAAEIMERSISKMEAALKSLLECGPDPVDKSGLTGDEVKQLTQIANEARPIDGESWCAGHKLRFELNSGKRGELELIKPPGWTFPRWLYKNNGGDISFRTFLEY